MTREEAIKILKENFCAMCAYGSQNMDSCDIRSCDNKDAIKALEQEPCGKDINVPATDTISRQAMHIELEKWITYGEYRYSNATKYLYDRIDRLPPVTPQPKTGHWRKMVIAYDVLSGEHKRVPYTAEDEKMVNAIVYTCDCGCEAAKPHNYCPNCGAKMESEDSNENNTSRR